MQKRLCTIFLSCLLLAVGLTMTTIVSAHATTTNDLKSRADALKIKIGQMLIIGFNGMTILPDDAIAKAILAQEIGGVVLFDYDFKTKTFEHNIKNPQQLKELTASLQNYARDAARLHHNTLVPLLIGVDYEGGNVNRLKERYGFPKTFSAAEIGAMNENAAKIAAQQMAETLKAAGINLNFAPVLDVNVNPDNPIIAKLGRSFSTSAKKVAVYASIFAQTYAEYGIACAFKHFPGHGSSTGDTHAGFVDVTQTWVRDELLPYQELLNSQSLSACPMVMTAHVVHRGLDEAGNPASLSYEMTTKLLRNQLKFSGVIVTDDLQMKAITTQYGVHEAVRMAVNAGADILLFGNQLVDRMQDPKEIVEMIYQDVMDGKIAQSRIEESFERIVKLKAQLRDRDHEISQ